MIDFDPGPELSALRGRVRAFVDSEVIPREQDLGDHDSLERVRRDLQRKAKAAGLFAPTLPKTLGGLGLSWREIAVVLEESGRSLFGPQALNAAAPDEGNMHMLEHVASEAQKKRWLAPLAAGEIRSCFASLRGSRGPARWVDPWGLGEASRRAARPEPLGTRRRSPW